TTLATKRISGRKKNKERLTTALCCNADGSFKLPPLVIGKFKNPRAFKNVNLNVGIKYRWNSKAWMTGLLFQESPDSPQKLNVLGAVRFIVNAWDNVSQQTIINCWNHTGLIKKEESIVDNLTIEKDTEINLMKD
ncbi:hypothetical protein B4U79_10377, partial [Dinothrombium tinctorium]